MSKFRYGHKWAILLIIVMLLSSACTLRPPPSPPTPAPPNQSPIIHYMTAQQQVLPSSSSEIKCIATDPDTNTLVYSWSADQGIITGMGDSVTWTAPDMASDYAISVTVSDGKGGEATDSVTVSVTPKPNQVPTIISIIVTLKDQPPITASDEPIRVKRWSSPEIECIAEDSDGDEITFMWSATEGKVDGEGANVHYIASSTGNQAVTVTVVDGRGGQTKRSVYFDVPCCGGQ